MLLLLLHGTHIQHTAPRRPQAAGKCGRQHAGLRVRRVPGVTHQKTMYRQRFRHIYAHMHYMHSRTGLQLLFCARLWRQVPKKSLFQRSSRCMLIALA